MPVFVRQHIGDGDVAEIVSQIGEQHAAVPTDGVVEEAEAGVLQTVGVVAAELLVLIPAGIPGDQRLDRGEVVVERLAVGGLPEVLDVADRGGGELVDLPAVTVLDIARRLLGVGPNPDGPSTAGMPATLNGSSKTETAVPATVVEQAATSSAVHAASTAPVRGRIAVRIVRRSQCGGVPEPAGPGPGQWWPRTAAATRAGTRRSARWPSASRAPPPPRGRRTRRSSRPAPWASSRAAWLAATAMKPLPPCAATARCARRQQRIVRARERNAVDQHERQRWAGHVDALPQRQRAEQRRRRVIGELAHQRRRGVVALAQDRSGQPLAHDLGGGPGGAHRREESKCAATRGRDQRLDLVELLGGPGAVAPGRGQMCCDIEDPGLGVLER